VDGGGVSGGCFIFIVPVAGDGVSKPTLGRVVTSAESAEIVCLL